jgi:hypothetical protein
MPCSTVSSLASSTRSSAYVCVGCSRYLPINTGPTLEWVLLQFLKVIVTAIVCATPAIGCLSPSIRGKKVKLTLEQATKAQRAVGL